MLLVKFLLLFSSIFPSSLKKIVSFMALLIRSFQCVWFEVVTHARNEIGSETNCSDICSKNDGSGKFIMTPGSVVSWLRKFFYIKQLHLYRSKRWVCKLLRSQPDCISWMSPLFHLFFRVIIIWFAVLNII